VIRRIFGRHHSRGPAIRARGDTVDAPHAVRGRARPSPRLGRASPPPPGRPPSTAARVRRAPFPVGMMNCSVGINDEPSAPSAECWGGGPEARGLGGTRGSGHAKQPTEQPRPQHVVRLVFGARSASPEATTTAGQPWEPSQPRHLNHEQRRESDYAKVEVTEEGEEGEGGEEVERREEPRPPRTVRFVPVALAAPQRQPRAKQPRRQHEQQHWSSDHEEVEVKEEGCSDEDAEAEEQEATEKEGRQREQHARDLGASSEGREEADADVAAPASRRARRPPGSYADTAAVEWDSDDEYEGGEEEEEEEEEEEVEEAEEGEGNESKGNSVHGGPGSREADDRRSSRVAGVSWRTTSRTWEARHWKGGKGMYTYLGRHATEEGAAQAVHYYVNGGVDPVQHRGVRTSQFKGVCWDHRAGKWRAQYKEKHLGNHATEEAAARAYDLYVEDGVDPVQHRGARTSEFKGVSWHKSSGKWQAVCKKTHVGLHATEEAAARAYNKEAERIGCVDLNVIPPAGDADSSNTTIAAAALALSRPAAPAHAHANAGSKRAAPTIPAPPQAEMTRLGTSAAAADVRAATSAAVHSATLQARVNGEVEEKDSYEETEEAEAGEDDDEAQGRREQHAHAPSANLSRRLEAGSGAAEGSKRASPSPPAPQQTKTMWLETSAAAEGLRASAAPAPANAAMREAAWVARITAEKAKAEVAEARTTVAEANTKVAVAQAAIAKAQAAAEKAKAALADKQLAAHVAEQAAVEAERKAA